MTIFRRIIEKHINKNEEEIRADAIRKFTKWLVNSGYLDEDGSEWRDSEYWVNKIVNSIINRYEREQNDDEHWRGL